MERRPKRGVLAALAALAVLASVAIAPHTASAQPTQPRVMVLGTAEDRPGLLSHLRIHLSGRAEIVAAPGLSPADLAGKLAAARSMMSERGASLAVWIESAGAAGDVILYAVGEREDTALVKVARLPAGEAAEVDRALALKVSEFLDTMLEPVVADPTPRVTRALRPRVDANAAPRAATKSQRRSLGPAVELAAELAGGAGSAPRSYGLVLGVGAGLGRGRWSGEAIAAVRLGDDIERRRPAGQVSVDETGFALGVRAGYQVSSRLRVGGRVEARARLLSADGVAADGRTGSVSRVVPGVALGAELRVAVASDLGAGLFAGVDNPMTRHDFAIDGEPVVDIGGARGVIMLFVSFIGD